MRGKRKREVDEIMGFDKRMDCWEKSLLIPGLVALRGLAWRIMMHLTGFVFSPDPYPMDHFGPPCQGASF